MFEERGDKHTQSSLEHREIFQTLFMAAIFSYYFIQCQIPNFFNSRSRTVLLKHFLIEKANLVSCIMILFYDIMALSFNFFSKLTPVTGTCISGQSVWNTVTPARIGSGQVKESFFEKVGGGDVVLHFKVDEFVGNGWRIS